MDLQLGLPEEWILCKHEAASTSTKETVLLNHSMLDTQTSCANPPPSSRVAAPHADTEGGDGVETQLEVSTFVIELQCSGQLMLATAATATEGHKERGNQGKPSIPTVWSGDEDGVWQW